MIVREPCHDPKYVGLFIYFYFYVVCLKQIPCSNSFSLVEYSFGLHLGNQPKNKKKFSRSGFGRRNFTLLGWICAPYCHLTLTQVQVLVDGLTGIMPANWTFRNFPFFVSKLNNSALICKILTSVMFRRQSGPIRSYQCPLQNIVLNIHHWKMYLHIW